MTALDRVTEETGMPEVIEAWLAGLNGPDTSTRRTYADAVLVRAMPFVARAGGAANIGPREAAGVVAALSRRFEPATVGVTASALSSLWRVLLDRGMVERNPWEHVRRPKPKTVVGERLISAEEVAALVQGATSLRDRVLIRVLYVTGARVSEIVRPRRRGVRDGHGLRWRDVRRQPDGGAYLHLLGKGDKSRTVWIDEPLTDDLWALSRMHRLQDPVLPMSRVRAWQIIKAAAHRAQVTDAVSPHWLRHSNAVDALAAGAALNVVQAQLGHARLETTGIYTRIRPGHGTAGYVQDPDAR